MTSLEHQKALLFEEISDRVNKLNDMGIDVDNFLKSLMKNSKPNLSRIIITKDHRIMLPAYNKEIKLYPLSKALFILYLKHEEGIHFKMLSNYRKELEDIYIKVSLRTDVLTMQRSVNSLVNPLNNSINECCSRIKAAFINELDYSVINQYIITGTRGEKKRVLLDRSLVLIEDKNL
jgi:hypothetical protein